MRHLDDPHSISVYTNTISYLRQLASQWEDADGGE